MVILCLPDPAAKESVALADSLGGKGPRILDASTAHRVTPGWTYGFPELAAGQGEAIAAARRVANPGCYATGAIAMLRPLIDAGLIASDQSLALNAISGYSGGGKQMIEAYETGKGRLSSFTRSIWNTSIFRRSWPMGGCATGPCSSLRLAIFVRACW